MSTNSPKEAPKSLVVASLNLWCFYDWEKRFPAIIKLLKEVNPDILVTQETQRNLSIDTRSSIEMINAELGYPHMIFAPADIKLQQKGVIFEHPVEHGLGALSKWPLTHEFIPLTKAIDDKEKRGVLECEIDVLGKKHSIMNVHFSNSDERAENHFKETLRTAAERGNNSILSGDFNIFNIEKYKALYGDQYVSSSESYAYVSYPDDQASFDYILIPKNYSFENFECREEYVSDHRMIVAKIKLP